MVFDDTAAIRMPVEFLKPFPHASSLHVSFMDNAPGNFLEELLDHFPPVYDQRTVLDYCTVRYIAACDGILIAST